MTDQETICFENLKTILKNIRTPQLLDDHPWTHALIVRQSQVSGPQPLGASPGQQLVAAMAELFSSMQPPAPPRRGKRLDSRWGEFGLLAALYFTPFNHGTPYPSTFMEAWERIDPAILQSMQILPRPIDDILHPELLIVVWITWQSIPTTSSISRILTKKSSEITSLQMMTTLINVILPSTVNYPLMKLSRN